MTVATTNITSGPYSGNDVADSFAYTFRIDDESQVAVYESAAAGIPTLLTLDTDYTVSGVGDDNGGYVTRVSGALLTGSNWYIRSDYSDTQDTSFSSQGGFFPDVHESALDKLTFVSQQQEDKINRSIRLSDFDESIESISMVLPSVADRANQFLGFDLFGAPTSSPLSVGNIASSIVSDLTTMRSGTVVNNESVLMQYHTAASSGGGGLFRGVTGAAPGTYVDNNGTIIVPNGGDGSAAWLRNYNNVINVEWFGVTKDGVDRVTELNLLGTALSAGDAVNFGGGIIGSSGNIVFPAGIHIFGSAEIKALNTISSGLFKFLNVGNIRVDGLTFTVEGANNASLLYFNPTTDLENVLITNCTFNSTGFPAVYHAGAGFAISNFIVNQCNFYGDGTAEGVKYEFGSLVFSRGFNPCIVDKCYFEGCLTSFATSGTGLIKDTRFTNNKVYNCTGRPIFVYHAVDSLISGNTFDTYVDAAWFEQKCIITNNLFRNSENDGVLLYNADKVFSGNSVYNNGGNGLVLSVELRNCLIEGNNIYGNGLNGVRVSAEPRGDTWTGASRIYNIDLKSNLIKSNGLNGVYLDDIQKDGITFGNSIEQVTLTNNTIERNGVTDEALGVPLNDACGILHKEFGASTATTTYNIIGNKISNSLSNTGVQGNQYNAIYINDSTSGIEKNINVIGNELKADSAGIAFKNNKTGGVKTVINNVITGVVTYSGLGIKSTHGNFYTDRTSEMESTFSGLTVGWSTATPTAGTYTLGSLVYNRQPSGGGNIGWVCIVAGTPGTWKTFGVIAA